QPASAASSSSQDTSARRDVMPAILSRDDRNRDARERGARAATTWGINNFAIHAARVRPLLARRRRRPTRAGDEGADAARVWGTGGARRRDLPPVVSAA